ncbi:MAG: DUF4124 domain-containing protein [Rhodocyclaceae bacterium]|nr:DUF4124 domain-containing protein [Rhodocyclaceae bacterium]
MRLRAPLQIATALALVTLPPLAAAQVHVWKDAEGQTHYADVPPPGVESTEVLITAPAASAGGQAKRKSLAEQEEEFRKRHAERQEASHNAADDNARKAKIEQQCSNARGQLAAIESGRRMARYNANGEPEFLTDEQRAKHAADLRKLIEERCK